MPNPNITVLEWLNTRPGFQGRVAAFGSWDVLPFILNTGRSRSAGRQRLHARAAAEDRSRARDQRARRRSAGATGTTGPFDAPIVYAALERLRTDKPRVLYIMLGEGDEWAHDGRYDLYLDATFRADRFIHRIWDTLQSMPEYANQTTLLVTTDHGRGATTADWNDHGTQGAGRRIDVDAGARARRSAARRARRRDRHHVATGRDDRRWRWARTSGRAVPTAAPPLPLAK